MARPDDGSERSRVAALGGHGPTERAAPLAKRRIDGVKCRATERRLTVSERTTGHAEQLAPLAKSRLAMRYPALIAGYRINGDGTGAARSRISRRREGTGRRSRRSRWRTRLHR